MMDRRTFLLLAPALTLGLKAIASAQIVERGRFSDDDLPLVRGQLLQMVNRERLAAGTSQLELDELAGQVAKEHALDMAKNKFVSHWSRDGRKPYQRYSFAGGIDAVQENISAADNVVSLTPKSVLEDLREMHLRMLSELPPNDGHRQAMLASQQTHVGFGVALDQNSLRLVELYVAKYVRLDSVPRQVGRKETVILTGKLINANQFLHQVDVFYEPLPTPADIDWLRTARPYALPEDYVTLRPKAPKGARYKDGTTGDYDWNRNGKFRVPAKLFKDAPGIFTIVFWIRRVPADKAFPATEICIRGE